DQTEPSDPSDPSGQPEDPAAPVSRRSGLDIAREALARARTEGPPLGFVPGRPSAPADRGDVPGRRRRSRFGDETRSGAHPDERDPQLLGPTLERLVRDRG